jgi:hypothetical protein
MGSKQERRSNRRFREVILSPASAPRVWRGLIAVAAVSLCGALPAAAHHSFAMYDNDHQIKLNGVVSKFEWTNPHVYIDLMMTDAQGASKPYTVECAAPGILNRNGWKFNMLKPGDKVVLIVAPLRTSSDGGLLKEITVPDGRVLTNGGFAGPALIH